MLTAIAGTNHIVPVTLNTEEFAKVIGLRLEEWQILANNQPLKH